MELRSKDKERKKETRKVDIRNGKKQSMTEKHIEEFMGSLGYEEYKRKSTWRKMITFG